MMMGTCIKILAAFILPAILTPARADPGCVSACLAPPAVAGATAAPRNPALCLQACGYQPSIDYKCVQQCAAVPGGSTAACPRQCGYYPDDLLQRLVRPATLTPHNQFAAPQPAAGILVDPPAPTPASTPKTQLAPNVQPLSPSLNYKTLALCLQNGFSYAYCRSAAHY